MTHEDAIKIAMLAVGFLACVLVFCVGTIYLFSSWS